MRLEVHLLAELVSCIAASDEYFLSTACYADLLAILLDNLELIWMRGFKEDRSEQTLISIMPLFVDSFP